MFSECIVSCLTDRVVAHIVLVSFFHLSGLARDSGYAEESPLPKDFQHHIRFADYSCGAIKINCAVDRLPNFECYPSPADGVCKDFLSCYALCSIAACYCPPPYATLGC